MPNVRSHYRPVWKPPKYLDPHTRVDDVRVFLNEWVMVKISERSIIYLRLDLELLEPFTDRPHLVIKRRTHVIKDQLLRNRL